MHTTRREAVRPRRGALAHHTDQVASSSQRFGSLRRGQRWLQSHIMAWQCPNTAGGSRACSTSSAAALRFSYSLSDKLRSVAGDSHGDAGPCIVQSTALALGAAPPARAHARHRGTRREAGRTRPPDCAFE